MFIAVINENFNVAEESKRGQQANHYWAAQQPQKAKATWMRKFNPYRWFKASPKASVVENLPSSLVLPMQKALVLDYGLPSQDRRPNTVYLLLRCFSGARPRAGSWVLNDRFGRRTGAGARCGIIPQSR